MGRAALDGRLGGIGVARHPQFGLLMPESCTDVPPEVLNTRNTWRDKNAYDLTARDLTKRFEANLTQVETYVVRSEARSVGREGSVRVDHGGVRNIKKKKTKREGRE